MSITKRINAGAVLAAGALLLSSSAQSAILPASGGHPFDSAKRACFHKGWEEPGRVSYSGSSGCGDLVGIWHMAVPISSTGSKTFSVFAKDATAVATKCFVLVNGANGGTLRWDDTTFSNTATWYPFDPVTVNSNETVVVACDIGNTTFGGESWVSAIKGF